MSTSYVSGSLEATLSNTDGWTAEDWADLARDFKFRSVTEVDRFVDRMSGDYAPRALLALLENTRLRMNHAEEEAARDDFDRDYFRRVLWHSPGGSVHVLFGEFDNIGQIIPKLEKGEEIDEEEWNLLLREAKGVLAEFFERRAQIIQERALDHLGLGTK